MSRVSCTGEVAPCCHPLSVHPLLRTQSLAGALGAAPGQRITLSHLPYRGCGWGGEVANSMFGNKMPSEAGWVGAVLCITPAPSTVSVLRMPGAGTAPLRGQVSRALWACGAPCGRAWRGKAWGRTREPPGCPLGVLQGDLFFLLQTLRLLLSICFAPRLFLS